jgi:hypothetical protein
LFPESLPCAQKVLSFELLFLPRTPCLDGVDSDLGILAGLWIIAHDPMDGAKKFQPERIFKALDQPGNAIDARQRFGVIAKER